MSPRLVALTTALAAALAAGCGDGGHDHDHGDGHDHAGHDEHGHDEHGHDEHGHGAHGEGDATRVTLSADALASAALSTARPAAARIEVTVDLPGEVIADPDRVAHVTPRAAGTAVEVGAVLGARVAAGDVLAVIESPELGAAKIDCLESLRAEHAAEFDHARQAAVSADTHRLLAILAEGPSPQEARERATALVIGEDRARLLGTYAALHLARAARDREEDLARRRVNSESELLAARAAYDAASAEHAAARESVAFSHRARVLDAERALLLARASLRNRQRRLHLLGVPPGEVERLEDEAADRIARCTLRAPIDGVVIRKHLVLGENVETASEVFVLADLSSVVVRFAVPPGDLARVRERQRVRVRVDGAAGPRDGTIGLLGHTADGATRSVEARARLANPGGDLRPGLPATVAVVVEEVDAALALPVAAVVRVENRDVVFVRAGEGTFDVRPVRLGRSDAHRIEILDGVAAADEVVVENAFVLKAELRKGTGGHEH